MKLSHTLLRQHKGYWFKQLWKNRSQVKVKPVVIPKPLVKAGVKPKDAVQEYFPEPSLKVWIPPNDPRFMFPPRTEDDPNWHDDKVFSVTNNTRLWEGTKQIQCLTNTKVNQDRLPDRISQYHEEYPHLDHLIHRCILQANVWDTAREKLPKRKKPDDISIMHYKAEFGIPHSRIVQLLLRSLTVKAFQLQCLTKQNHAEKKLIEDFQLYTNFLHSGEPVHMSCKADFLISSMSPLHRFADETEVLSSMSSEIEDIFPIAPTIDLDKTNVYRARDETTYPSLPHLNYHTLLLPMNPEWSVDQRHASALLRSYGYCIETARNLEIKDLLANPVSIQTIHTDGEVFGFTCFQLNTLETDYKKDDAIRNQAWVYSDRLYVKQIPRRAMLRNTKYHSYNGQVAHKIMGMLFNQ